MWILMKGLIFPVETFLELYCDKNETSIVVEVA
jgi:hypothetical protein